MTLKFPPIDQKCHKSFIILLKIKEKILWCLVSFIFRISPMIRGLKIDLWILVIWSKHFWGYFLNIEAVSYMWTFPNSCRPSEARSPTKHDNFPFVCVAVIHSKTSGNLPSLQGSKITEFNAKQKNGKAQFTGKSCTPWCQVLQASHSSTFLLPPQTQGLEVHAQSGA